MGSEKKVFLALLGFLFTVHCVRDRYDFGEREEQYNFGWKFSWILAQ